MLTARVAQATSAGVGVFGPMVAYALHAQKPGFAVAAGLVAFLFFLASEYCTEELERREALRQRDLHTAGTW